MRPSSSAFTFAATAGLLLLPAALAAQASGSPGAGTRPPGCRGTTTQSNSFTMQREGATPWVWTDYAQVETVQPGSPADVAGMKAGDLVTTMDGRDLIASPPPPHFAGDTVHLVVWRDGREVPLTVVLGRWDPPQEAPGVTRVCRRVDVPSAGG